MGKVIQFPNNYLEVKEDIKKEIKIKEVENVFIEESSIKTYKRESKTIEKAIVKKKINFNKLKLIISYLSKVKFINKKKFLIGFLTMILIVGAKFGCNSFVKSQNLELSFIESFNLEMNKEVLNNYDEEFALASHSKIKSVESENELDISTVNVVIDKTVEGEEFAVYNAQIKLSLDAKDIKVKNGKKTFKFKDVNIQVVDVSADLTDEDMLLLPEESIATIAKESSKLTKEIEKELKKEKDYVCSIIESQM